MKIAYVTTYDSSDLHAWSGSGAYILRSLQQAGFLSESIGNLKDRTNILSPIKKALYSKVLDKTYLSGREPAFSKYYSTQVEAALATVNHDIVFSPGTTAIAYLATQKPIVFWADATFAGMVNFYPGYKKLCTETIKKGNEIEQEALSRCHLAIYCSEWAANSAIQNYDVDPSKVKVVPFGANIDCNRNIQDIYVTVDNKSFETCKLLFIGVEWFRKGGDVALKVAELLNLRGIKTELNIVGCTAPFSVPGFVKQHGFISKNTKEGRRSLDKLIEESHFLIVPSQAECYGVVFAEASSFGVPSLATKVGGITTAIHDGKNGQTFELDENPQIYCDYIEKLMLSKHEYVELALSSFKEYSERLNWSSSGRKVYDLVQEFRR